MYTNIKKLLSFTIILALLGIAVYAGSNSRKLTKQRFSYQYATKAVCGKASADSLEPLVEPEHYLTTINVHNPSYNKFEYKVKFALAGFGEDGEISDWQKISIGPDGAQYFNCKYFWELTGKPTNTFIDGFFVIESSKPLDVQTFYTGAANNKLSSLDVEATKGQRIRITTQTKCPDLVVTKIFKPEYDDANKSSIIKAVIKNIGNDTAGESIARVIDPSTNQSSGAPYNAIATVPSLAPNASYTVTFTLPYWVYNPDAELEVTADYKGMVTECNEDNNVKTFSEIG